MIKLHFIQTQPAAADFGPTPAHTLQDTTSTRKILSLSLSSEKLVSISSYQREPRRATLSIFTDAWITAHILDPAQSSDRGISHYALKISHNNVLIFSGYIDTSALSYNPASAELELTAYDPTKLLQLYEDLEKLYSLTAGYDPSWVLTYYLQAIQAATGISSSLFTLHPSLFTWPTLAIAPGSELILTNIDYSDLIAEPIGTPWTYSWHANTWTAPEFGYYTNFAVGDIFFIFTHFKILVASGIGGPQWAQVRARARVVKITNHVCTEVFEYDHRSDWTGYSQIDSLTAQEAELHAFIMEKTGLEAATVAALPGSFATTICTYSSVHLLDSYLRARFSGQLAPRKLQLTYSSPGASDFDLRHSHLKVIQAMLLLYNCTITASALGIQMRSKDHDDPTPIEIPATAVVGSPSIRRVPAETPDLSALDILSGDSSILQEYLKPYLMAWHARWELNLTIDDLSAYTLSLGSIITFQENDYMIVELTTDFEKDEYLVRGWSL